MSDFQSQVFLCPKPVPINMKLTKTTTTKKNHLPHYSNTYVWVSIVHNIFLELCCLLLEDFAFRWCLNKIWKQYGSFPSRTFSPWLESQYLYRQWPSSSQLYHQIFHCEATGSCESHLPGLFVFALHFLTKKQTIKYNLISY